jgi:hypothetical protein
MPVPSAAPEHPRPSLAAQQRQHSLPVVSVAAVGVHYGTAIAACRIVACNQPGALRNDDNHTTVTLGFGDVLPAGKYWYHLGRPRVLSQFIVVVLLLLTLLLLLLLLLV